MSAPPEALDAPKTRARDMYRAMVGLGLLCGVLIVSVFVATEERIEQNRVAALERAIRRVLPGTVRSVGFVELASGGFVRSAREGNDSAAGELGDEVYAGYDAEGRLLGLAIEGQGVGYQDVISVLYGYSFEQGAIIGLEILASLETPGLGDRIETDPTFLANFEALDVRLDASGTDVANPIVAVKSGEKSEPWQVDGITGATISSVAIADILRESTRQWIPKVRGHWDRFREVDAE